MQAISRYELTGSGLGHRYRLALARYLEVSADELEQAPPECTELEGVSENSPDPTS